MSLFWENLKEKVKTGLSISSEKIEEYSHIGKLKLDILATRRNIGNLQKELGKRSFQMIEEEKGNQITQDEQVKSLCKKIQTAMQMIVDLETKLADASKKNKEKSTPYASSSSKE